MTTLKPNMNWIGFTISNRYEIKALLGQGGMSEVYKAYDPNLARSVAIKLIHRHLSSDPEFVRRFEQEARAVAQLRHPNIIQVYDFDHDGDFYYMVLEYVQGDTLRDKLQALSDTHQSLQLSDTIRIMADICEAVAYAHYKGMIHRDLKPANVILKPKEQSSQLEQPILMDFGVAKLLSGTQYTATGAFIGTAKYMSPEQAQGNRPDERTDIYSLGVMLFEMVMGQAPFEADSTVATLMKHVTEPVPDIRQIQRDVPEELVAIIEKALAKEPADRYQTAAEMAVALKAIDLHAKMEKPATAAQILPARERHHTEPVMQKPMPVAPTPRRAPSVTPTIQPVKPRRRPVRLIGVLTIGFILILVLGFGVSLLFSSSQPSQTAAEKSLPLSKGMVQIQSGVYTIGLDPPDRNHADMHQVELAEFWIDQYEVTNAQYADFLKAAGKSAPADWPGGQVPAGQEKYPVKGISWDMAVNYCQQVNKRLPSEAEWEIAARGPERRLYPWGNDPRAVELPKSGTYKVGGKPTNQSPFGVFDMAGNVWEWVGETYAPVEKDGQRVLRGGANDLLKDMAYRLQGDPNAPTMSAASGIRCAANQVKIVEANKAETGGVLYQDDFADPGSGWPILAEGTYFFGYHPPDFYHIEIRTGGRRTAITRKTVYGDVTVEAKVLVDHSGTESGDFRYGLVLRRAAEDQFYAFTISPRKGAWYILKHSPSGFQTLMEGKVDTLQGFAPQGFSPDKTDTLRVEASGSKFSFSVNSQVVASVSDANYASGEVGFYVETFDENLVHIHYDSLTIWAAGS